MRSPTEIAATLDEDGLNRGLSFDREMIPYCGRKFHVKDRVRHIIDDKTGRMLNIPKDCIILDGASARASAASAAGSARARFMPIGARHGFARVEQSDRV